jgi:hypothetical protein
VLILDSQAETSIPFAQELGKIDTVVHAAAKYECLSSRFNSNVTADILVFFNT